MAIAIPMEGIHYIYLIPTNEKQNTATHGDKMDNSTLLQNEYEKETSVMVFLYSFGIAMLLGLAFVITVNIYKYSKRGINWIATVYKIRRRTFSGCAICLEAFAGCDVELGCLRSCGHYFHWNCITKWLQTHNTCPMCRAWSSAEKIVKVPNIHKKAKEQPAQNPLLPSPYCSDNVSGGNIDVAHNPKDSLLFCSDKAMMGKETERSNTEVTSIVNNKDHVILTISTNV